MNYSLHPLISCHWKALSCICASKRALKKPTNSRVPQDWLNSLILRSALPKSDIKVLNKILLSTSWAYLNAKCTKDDSILISLQYDCKSWPIMSITVADIHVIIIFTFGCNWICTFWASERPAKVNRAKRLNSLSPRAPFRSRADEKSHPLSASVLRDASAKYADTTPEPHRRRIISERTGWMQRVYFRSKNDSVLPWTVAPLFFCAFGAMHTNMLVVICDLLLTKYTQIVDTETKLNPPLESFSCEFNSQSRTDRDNKVNKLITQITISSC